MSFKVTESRMIEAFNYWNEKAFSNQIKRDKLHFEVKPMKNYIGKASWVKNGLGESKKYIITINPHLALNENDFNDTFLHEMIHIYVYQLGINCGHGGLFLQLMKSFNSRFGTNMTVERAKTVEEVATATLDNNYKLSYIGVFFDDKENKFLICKLASTAVSVVERNKNTYCYKFIGVYTTNNRYLGMLTNCISKFHFRAVSVSEYKNKIEPMFKKKLF